MSYVSAVSGKGGEEVEEVKRIILQSNPLLEAFGNAKTLRNNNSSRFGKYFEIKFNERTGCPEGGFITNYLLEKSRVCHQEKGERNFHIFYQLLNGVPKSAREPLGLSLSIDSFSYLNQSGTTTVPGIDDEKEFKLTRAAMKAVGMKGREQEAIFKLVAGVLHLGNVQFKDRGNADGSVSVKGLSLPSHLLGIEEDKLQKALTYRHIKTGREEYDVPNNTNQARNARDALAKAAYTRLFDWLVSRVNSSMVKDVDKEREKEIVCIGVLDIFGFEVFEMNGFEQFCINFVNEKLQQIFIELTLRSEQEEYVSEGIAWKPVKYFDNRIVCQLADCKNPPGIFRILDDVCATMHADSKGSGRAVSEKLSGVHGSHPHFSSTSGGFLIKHFAGDVRYTTKDFAEKNKDTLFLDILMVATESTSRLMKVLFPEEEVKERMVKKR